jgi:hypothetical protein
MCCRRRDRARLADGHGPPPRRPRDRRTAAALRIAGRERARRVLAARASPRSTSQPAGGVARRMAVAGRRLELRPEGHRTSLLLPRVAGADVGPARVRPSDRRRGREVRGEPHCGALPGASPVPAAVERGADPPVVHRPALPTLLALRRPPGARHPGAHGASKRRARGRRRRAHREPKSCRTVAGNQAGDGGSLPNREAATWRWWTGVAPDRAR